MENTFLNWKKDLTEERDYNKLKTIKPMKKR